MPLVATLKIVFEKLEAGTQLMPLFDPLRPQTMYVGKPLRFKVNNKEYLIPADYVSWSEE